MTDDQKPLPDPNSLPRRPKPAKKPQRQTAAERPQVEQRLPAIDANQVERFSKLRGLKPPKIPRRSPREDWNAHSARLLAEVLKWISECWDGVPPHDQASFLAEILRHEPRLIVLPRQRPADVRTEIDRLLAPYVERIDAGANKTAVAHAVDDLPVLKEQK